MQYLTEFGVLSPEHPLRKLAKILMVGAPKQEGDKIMSVIHAAREAFLERKPGKAKQLHGKVVDQIKGLSSMFDNPGEDDLWPLLAQAHAIHEAEAGGPRRTTRRAPATSHTPGRPERARRARGPVDSTAKDLQGLSLDEMYEYASPILGKTIEELKTKYGHLNPGLIRMNLGNRVRSKGILDTSSVS